ncbi:YfkD family protein [Oceanobacillus alkalisoli]|uniref:YfkD family protein n=1 Tax=Oceanobacillus alkalisoli TaxID=2925113 RepID=UPI001EF10D91|nr:YfkD family protein [Oceanobacillus alkalisoli]MCF3943630.1 YfkD family protein [Oceanobacillus alkalisoli]MCG5104973.1 YfkD family protein [Oceanobacillus alkalisoli]
MNSKRLTGMSAAFFIILAFPVVLFAEEKKETEENFEIPSHVLDISKENTVQNDDSDNEVVEASEETRELLESTSVAIENSELIQQLNESSIKPSPIGIGYRGEIYLGRWPLQYESLETGVNWEYQAINKNELQNGSEGQQEMNYIQQENKEIKGMLTNKIADAGTVKNMVLQKAEEKTKLPLAYEVEVGRNTKMAHAYPVPQEKMGILEAYAPAIHEKGRVTFGEVYIQLKGTKKQLVIKNVTKQGIGAWIPVQNYISYNFQVK